MYKVLISSHAEKDLDRLDNQVLNWIVPAIMALANDPRPPGSIKVKSEEGVWRIRVSDWRIGYSIDDDNQEIRVVRVGHRSEFY